MLGKAAWRRGQLCCLGRVLVLGRGVGRVRGVVWSWLVRQVSGSVEAMAVMMGGSPAL